VKRVENFFGLEVIFLLIVLISKLSKVVFAFQLRFVESVLLELEFVSCSQFQKPWELFVKNGEVFELGS